LATQFDDFWKGEPPHATMLTAFNLMTSDLGPQTEDNFGSLLGSGVFNSDGESHPSYNLLFFGIINLLFLFSTK
jgi:hypothetical protein